MPHHEAFERTTHSLYNDILNYMIALKMIKFLIHLKSLSINYIFDIPCFTRFIRKNETQATNSNYLVYVDNALNVCIFQRWLARFFRQKEEKVHFAT